MTTPSGSDLRYDVDHLMVRGRRIFGWGWLAHRTRAVARAELRLGGEGWEASIAVTPGFTRADVAEAFPDFPHAATSGFVAAGYVPGSPIVRQAIAVTYADGEQEIVPFARLAQSQPAARPPMTLARAWRGLARRVRTRDFSGLLARLQDRTPPALDTPEAVDALVASLQHARAVRIVFDHDMGGGANQYRRQLVDRWRAAGDAVVLCTYHLPSLDYRVSAWHADTAQSFRAPSFTALEAIVARAPVAEIFVNSPVSFDEPAMFATWLARLRASYPAARLTLAVHDFFPVCPSYVLVDADGRYCGVPADLARCDDCLARHASPNVALSPPTGIAPWRTAWAECLRAADEVRCFSESSRVPLARAFPGLEHVTCVPHAVDYRPARLPRVDHAGPLVVGVLGTISEQKGAAQVVEIASLMERELPDSRIVVLGNLNAPGASRRLVVTGPYERERLPDLIERHGINVLLFPSIWPETFSFVVSEMMALDMPIVAFDLGAPAERLHGYATARLVARVDARAALDAARDLHATLAARTARAA